MFIIQIKIRKIIITFYYYMWRAAACSTDTLSSSSAHPPDTDPPSPHYSSMLFQLLRVLLWMRYYRELPFFILAHYFEPMISMNPNVYFGWLEFYPDLLAYSFIPFISLVFHFVLPSILIFFTFITVIFSSLQFILTNDGLLLLLSSQCCRDPRAQFYT